MADFNVLTFVLVFLSAVPLCPAGELRTGRPSPDPIKDAVFLMHWGTVTEIKKDRIAIQFEKEAPRVFLLSEAIRAGKVPSAPRVIMGSHGPITYDVSPGMMYRISDVKVGDLVAIDFSFIAGERICDHICIRKRPGGLVPPLPDEAEAKYIREAQNRPNRPPFVRYHELMNAWWDLEDRGIPYPEKFGDRRRWPVAPVPRAKPESRPIN